MSKVSMDQCDGCKKVVENRFKEPGWISLAATSISRSVGVFGQSAYETDYLRNVEDFCSIDCLVKALDQQAQARDSSKSTNRCTMCHKSCDPPVVCEGKNYHKHCHDSLVCGPAHKHP